MTEYLELAARGKTRWWRYPAVIVLAVVLWLLFMTVAIVVIELAGAMPADVTQALTQPKHIQVFYGSTGGLFGLLLVALTLAVRLLHGKRFGDIVGVWSWRRMATGAAIWLGVCLLAVTVDYLLQPSGFSSTADAATATLPLWPLPTLPIHTFTAE